MKLYYRGNIYGNKDADAFIEEKGIIKWIGCSKDLNEFEGEKIDLKNQFVYPGLIDSHMHMVNYGQSLRNVLLEQHTNSLSVLLAELKRNLKTGQWLIGRGWNQDYFTDEKRFPTRTDLDTISREIPIIITRTCGHVLVANSKAIELAKLDGKQIEGGKYNLESGLFQENALSLIYNAVPRCSVADIKEMILVAQKKLHSYGITSIQSDDFLSTTDDYHDTLTAFEELRNENKLTVRIYEQAQFTNRQKLEEFLNQGYNTGVGNEFFKIGPLKILGDGSLGARSAFMSEAYYDDKNTRGIPIFSKVEILEMFSYAHNHGMQIAIHAIGDGILDWILEAYETVLNNQPRDNHRHGLVHCQVMRQDQIKKIKALKLHGYIQSVFLDYDNHIINQRVNPKIAATSYNYKTLDEENTISNGSDCPVEEPDVLKGIQLAVTRTSLDGTGPFLAQQALTRDRAIASFTTGGAYASFEEKQKGKIAVGMYCDFVVLNDNILTVDVLRIKDIKVMATYVAGNLVYGGRKC